MLESVFFKILILLLYTTKKNSYLYIMASEAIDFITNLCCIYVFLEAFFITITKNPCEKTIIIWVIFIKKKMLSNKRNQFFIIICKHYYCIFSWYWSSNVAELELTLFRLRLHSVPIIQLFDKLSEAPVRDKYQLINCPFFLLKHALKIFQLFKKLII